MQITSSRFFFCLWCLRSTISITKQTVRSSSSVSPRGKTLVLGLTGGTTTVLKRVMKHCVPMIFRLRWRPSSGRRGVPALVLHAAGSVPALVLRDSLSLMSRWHHEEDLCMALHDGVNVEFDRTYLAVHSSFVGAAQHSRNGKRLAAGIQCSGVG